MAGSYPPQLLSRGPSSTIARTVPLTVDIERAEEALLNPPQLSLGPFRSPSRGFITLVPARRNPTFVLVPFLPLTSPYSTISVRAETLPVRIAILLCDAPYPSFSLPLHPVSGSPIPC